MSEKGMDKIGNIKFIGLVNPDGNQNTKMRLTWTLDILQVGSGAYEE
jgi:hypothetical protein